MKKIILLVLSIFLIIFLLSFLKKDNKNFTIDNVKIQKKKFGGEKNESQEVKTEKKSNEVRTEIEVSRKTKKCLGGKDCLQIKKKGKSWEILKSDIEGFNYKKGYYYVLDIKEKIVNNQKKIELIEIKKEIKPKKI